MARRMKPARSPSLPAADGARRPLGWGERGDSNSLLRGHNPASRPLRPRSPCRWCARRRARHLGPGGQIRTDGRLRVKELRCRCATPGWVGPPGIEPGRPAVSGRCRPGWLGACIWDAGGGRSDRRPGIVVPGGIEPPTSRVSRGRSDPLSYGTGKGDGRVGRYCPGSSWVEATRAPVNTSTPRWLRGRASNPRRHRVTTGRSTAELPRNEYRHGVLTPDFRIENPVDYRYPMAARRKVEESNSHGCPCRRLSKPRVPMDGTFLDGALGPAVSPVRFERTTPAFGGQRSGSAELRRVGYPEPDSNWLLGLRTPLCCPVHHPGRKRPEGLHGDACGARTRDPRIDNPVLSPLS
jgi:hypothetical protein